ncbi:MAG: glycosyltransferase family 39 protein [Lachnospiraceae bacterium]|nr:glycosyltransferase family 39 protein [Lachnospiraceae bacterium]
MADSILYFVQFTCFYFLYIIFIPAKVMKLKLSGREAGENAIKAVIASHVTIISSVYLLGLLHIYHTATLVITIVAVILVYWKIKGVCYREKFREAFRWTTLVSGGQYKFGIYAKRTAAKASRQLKHFFASYGKGFFSKHILDHLILLASLGALIARKWILVFDNYAYLTSDMYVHNEWINYMEQGDIFYDGVYPFGMHNMISAFHKLSGLNLNIVFRYWGAYNCVLMAIMLYFFARRIFHSRAAAMLPFLIYCVTDFTSIYYGYRNIYTLPQETGMLFLLPCVYYLGRFLKREKWKDGIFFALSAAIVLSMHFYTVIFAVLLCASLCVPFIKRVFRFSMIKKLLAGVGLIALISITPFVIGLASGKYWQGSMNWAMGVINSQSQGTEAEAQPEEESESKEESDEPAEGKTTAKTGQATIAEKILGKFLAVYQLQVEDMNSYWGYVFWICMGLFLLYYAVLLLTRKVTWKDKMYGGIWVFLLLMIVMYSYWILGIPKLMKEERMTMFIGYIAPLMLAFPVELFCRLIPKKVKSIGTLGSYIAAAALFFITYELGYMPVQTHFYLEPSLAAKVCVKADEELPKGNWTIVSPVEGLALVRNRGYHYELWEFISNMERYKEDMYLEIPTKYVFFVLEKQPIIYNEVRYSNLEYENEPIHEEDAERIADREILGISETGVMKYYNSQENRRMLEAKLAYWIEEYQKAFPDQMEAYMEDEECVVYKFEQNPYMMNNFAIDYGYNEISDLNYYKKLRGIKVGRKEDVSEIDAILKELMEQEKNHIESEK